MGGERESGRKKANYKWNTKDDDESHVIYNIYFHIFEWMISPPASALLARMNIYEY